MMSAISSQSMPDLTSRSVAAEHRRLALAWYESPPSWLADDGQWSLHTLDTWAQYYLALAQRAQGLPVEYAEQIEVLQWAYADTATWGDGVSWAKILSGRNGARAFADRVLTLLDQRDRRKIDHQQLERTYRRALAGFRRQYEVLTEPSAHVQQTEDRLAAAVEKCRTMLADEPSQRERYIAALAYHLEANARAHGDHVAEERPGRGGGLISSGAITQICRVAARAMVAGMLRERR
jgi:hypothetical protein